MVNDVTPDDAFQALMSLAAREAGKEKAKEVRPDWEEVEVWSNLTKIKALYEVLYGLKEQGGLGDDFLQALTHFMNVPDREFYQGQWKCAADVFALGGVQTYEFFENLLTGKHPKDYYEKWAAEVANKVSADVDSKRMRTLKNYDESTKEPTEEEIGLQKMVNYMSIYKLLNDANLPDDTKKPIKDYLNEIFKKDIHKYTT